MAKFVNKTHNWSTTKPKLFGIHALIALFDNLFFQREWETHFCYILFGALWNLYRKYSKCIHCEISNISWTVRLAMVIFHPHIFWFTSSNVWVWCGIGFPSALGDFLCIGLAGFSIQFLCELMEDFLWDVWKYLSSLTHHFIKLL